VAELTLKERARRRLDGLKKLRQPYEAEAKEIASYAQPARSRWLTSDANKNIRQANKRLNSSHGIFAFRTLQGGMTSGLSSPSRPWFTLKLPDEDLMEDPAVKAWLDIVQKRMEGFFAATNFYAAVKTGYLEIGLFGTEACVMVEHPKLGAVNHQLTYGEYWIGLGASLEAEALYRRCPLTIYQAVQKFGLTNVSGRIRRAYDGGRYEEVCEFYQAIEANDEQEPDYADWRGKPFRSLYWDEQDDRQGALTSLTGCAEQPFWAPRWDTTGGDTWGQGPGHDSLPDLRELQLQAKRKGEATDMHIWPEMVTDARVKLRRQPKSVVAASAVDMNKLVSVPYQVPYQAIEAVRVDLEACKQSINEATYADLFMAITNMQGVQPRNIEEIASRNEEKLTQLGPVIERVNTEKLEKAIDRAYGICERIGLFPPAPDAVQEAGGQVNVEFVSILTQMQRMVGLGQIERTIGFVGNVAGMAPEVRHKIDWMEVVDEYGDRAGMPSKLIRPTKEAQQDADAEATAAQQQQAAEMAAKAGPALKDVVAAGQLASQIPQAAPPALDDLAPA
jgi:hypothetical protein